MAPHARATSAEPSVDPLSTTIGVHPRGMPASTPGIARASSRTGRITSPIEACTACGAVVDDEGQHRADQPDRRVGSVSVSCRSPSLRRVRTWTAPLHRRRRLCGAAAGGRWCSGWRSSSARASSSSTSCTRARICGSRSHPSMHRSTGARTGGCSYRLPSARSSSPERATSRPGRAGGCWSSAAPWSPLRGPSRSPSSTARRG